MAERSCDLQSASWTCRKAGSIVQRPDNQASGGRQADTELTITEWGGERESERTVPGCLWGPARQEPHRCSYRRAPRPLRVSEPAMISKAMAPLEFTAVLGEGRGGLWTDLIQLFRGRVTHLNTYFSIRRQSSDKFQNEAGQRLTEFCHKNALIIANTLFQHTRWLYTRTSRNGQYQRDKFHPVD